MKPKLFISSFNKINNLKTTSRNKINKRPLIHSTSSNDFKINKNNLNFKKNLINFFGKTKEGFSKFPGLRKNINKISESKEEEKKVYNENIYPEDNGVDKFSKKSIDNIKKNNSDNSESDIEENIDNEEEDKSKDTINFSKYDFDGKSEKDESNSEGKKSSICSKEESEEEEKYSEKSKISNDECKEDSFYLTKKEKSDINTEFDKKSKISNSSKTNETEDEYESDNDEDTDSEEESFPDYEDSDESESSKKSEDIDTEMEEEEEEEDNESESLITKKTKYKKDKKRKISSDYSSDNRSSEDEFKDDPINNLYNKLCKKGLTYSISKIYDKNHKIIGKRILKSNYYLNSSKLNWIKAYHGTKYEFLESIFINGLKKPGEIINNNKKVKPRKGHIDFGKTFYNIKNWAKAIFVSPSIFYSSCSCYSEKIVSNGEKWRIVVEIKVKPDSFDYYDSTIDNYHFLENEPKRVEYRIDKKNNVYVYSILFVNDNFMKKAKKYRDGFVFY